MSTRRPLSYVQSKVWHFGQRKRDWGLRRALYWEVMNLLRRTIGLRVHYVTVGADLKRPHENVRPEVPPGYDTRIVGLDDLLPYADRMPDLSAEFLHDAFARGDECAANFFGDELVGYGFICRTRCRASDQLDVLIPKGFRYSYKDWTHVDHRRKNLSRMRGHVRFTTMPRPFEERSIYYVETDNYASLLHGYRHPRERGLRMGLCGWFSLFGRQIPFSGRKAKWIGFEVVRREDAGRRQYV
jgi:hypothetical protein